MKIYLHGKRENGKLLSDCQVFLLTFQLRSRVCMTMEQEKNEEEKKLLCFFHFIFSSVRDLLFLHF